MAQCITDSLQTMSPNVLRIDISPAQMTTRTEKKYKTAKMEEITSAVCALYNTGGGKLVLFHDEATGLHVNTCVRMIEQRVVEMVGTMTMILHVKFKVNPQEIILDIREASGLVTICYNLYLPSERQVLEVPATEFAEIIKELIQRTVFRKTIESHSKPYVKGQNSGLHEGTTVQLKCLKASSSKCVTLADRITGASNKLKCYISAFANRSGGHIYYGINDEGIVEGEAIKEKEKDKIIEKVAKTIEKMVWPQNCQPRKGKQWDIFFEPVENANGNPVPSTFVIVIYVAPCLGGVFTDEPESYSIVQGKVRKMSFKDWLSNFTAVSKHTKFQPKPSRVLRVSWSSERNRNIFRELSMRLVKHRNDEEMDAFSSLSKKAIEHFPESGAELTVKAEEVTAAYTHYHFRKAESLLTELDNLLTSSKDTSIFKVRMLLSKCTNELSKGNYKASYEIAQDGLQMMQLIPVELFTVWFYIQAAMNAISVSTETQDFERCRFLKNAALKYVELAARDANSLEDIPFRMSDLRQKLHIFKAWIILGCSITGEVVRHEHGIRYEDIKAAAVELASVFESDLKGSPLTHFRKTQFHLAQSDLFRRRSEMNQEDRTGNLKQAYECGSNALALARRHHFEYMEDYAKKRLADLTEKLVRHAFKTCDGQRNKNFFGFKY